MGLVQSFSFFLLHLSEWVARSARFRAALLEPKQGVAFKVSESRKYTQIYFNRFGGF